MKPHLLIATQEEATELYHLLGDALDHLSPPEPRPDLSNTAKNQSAIIRELENDNARLQAQIYEQATPPQSGGPQGAQGPRHPTAASEARTAELDAARHRIEELTFYLQSAEHRIQELKNENARLQAQVDEQQSIIEEQSDNLHHQTNTISRQADRIEDLEAASIDLNTRHQSLKNENARLKARLKAHVDARPVRPVRAAE